jgi:hypothetical protein
MAWGFRRGTLTCACPLVAQVDERNQHRQFILKAVRLRLPDGLCDASKRKPGTRLHAEMGPELGEAPSSARHYRRPTSRRLYSYRRDDRFCCCGSCEVAGLKRVRILLREIGPSVRRACRCVRTCIDREQPRRKIVPRRQVTRTSRPHSKRWRAVGCYLPSKRSGLSVRKKRERAKRAADPLGKLRRAKMFLVAERFVLPCPQVMSVPETPPLGRTSGGVLVFMVNLRSQSRGSSRQLGCAKILCLVSVGCAYGQPSQTHPRTSPVVSRHAERLQFDPDRENLPEGGR